MSGPRALGGEAPRRALPGVVLEQTVDGGEGIRHVDVVAPIDAGRAETALRMMERNMASDPGSSGEITFEDASSG